MNGKFRVWDGEEMHYPPHDYVMFGGGRLKRKFKRGEFTTLEPGRDKAQAMFSTGPPDAEGTEIYEGDVVQNEVLQAVVFWHEEGAQWGVGNISNGGSVERYQGVLTERAASNFTVIGNKHETPELLE